LLEKSRLSSAARGIRSKTARKRKIGTDTTATTPRNFHSSSAGESRAPE
jgi:hypothetical protein